MLVFRSEICVTAPRCDVCDRRVYLAHGDLPRCPVCLTPLVESRSSKSSGNDAMTAEADVA